MKPRISKSLFILYVADQQVSRDFYAAILATEPILDVPGMTEFPLSPGTALGLMPEAGIHRLLAGAIADPATATGVPRAELYLITDDAAAVFERAIAAGAREISSLQLRDWGDRVAYCQDLDGHVIALADQSATGAGG